MARPRSKKRRGWPDHLHPRMANGVVRYYFYRDPVTRKDVHLGSDLEEAQKAVRLFERKVSDDAVAGHLARLEGVRSNAGTKRMALLDYAEWFRGEHLPSRRMRSGAPLSTGTMKNWGWFLDRVSGAWPTQKVDEISTSHIVAFLDPIPPATANKYRGMLMEFFQNAAARGHRRDNPVAMTVPKDQVALRERLRLEDYQRIYAAAPAWLQRAMTLSLLSLQREGDLCTSLVGSWDGEWWSVVQGKGQGHGENRFRFKPPAELAQAIQACVEARVADCPYLLTRRPLKKRSIAAAKPDGKQHWAQLTEDYLSREFAGIRDDLGLFKQLPAGKLPPSYYEIKACGAKRYEDMGRPIGWIQMLAGHRDAETTRIYLDRHKTKWSEVDLTATGPEEFVRKRVAA